MIDITQVKQTIKTLQQKREKLEDERRELKFQLDKLQKEKVELEPQIREQFGTTDREPLLAKMQELETEVSELIKQAEAM